MPTPEEAAREGAKRRKRAQRGEKAATGVEIRWNGVPLWEGDGRRQ
jgi:hypothetical protein